MITQIYGILEQSEKKELGTPLELFIRINTGSFVGPWVTDLELTWDSYGDTCDTDAIDVSSNSPWVALSVGSNWTLSTTSGPAGLTNVGIVYTPDVIPDFALFRFKIGSTTLATLSTSSSTQLCA